jgi:hypothetical protein
MPQGILKEAAKVGKAILKSRESTARERAIARAGKKGQKGPLARILSKSRTGKPSPHTDPKPRKRMTADDLKKLMGRKKAGRATPGMKKAQPMAMKKGGTVTTTFHKSKAAVAKDKGPNTPGEKMRTIKGKVMAGQARTKKVLRGAFDIGKKIRYRRRGK